MARLDARTLYRLAHLTGLPHVARAAQRRRLLIVCYHGLREDDAPARHWLLLPRAEFEAQIAYLARHYECLPIDAALDRLWSGRLTTPTACVTFDDGYRNNMELGLPVLQRHGVPATIYLATGLIGTGEILWTTATELAFRHSPRPRVSLDALGLGEVALGDAAARARAGRAAVEALKLRPSAERRALHADLLARLGADTGDRRPFALLDWDEVRTVAASGLVTFGGHTVHHEIVSRLDDAEVEAEIGGSVSAVRREVPAAGVSATFAYPNGRPQDVDARAEAALARAGCVAAVTTSEGLNTPDVPRMRLRRLVVGGDITFDNFVGRAAAFRQLLRG